MLTGIFCNVQVMLDLFHPVQHFRCTLSRDVLLKSGICREYCLVFISADDLEKKVEGNTRQKHHIKES